MRIGHRHSVVSSAAVVDGMIAHELGAISILDARGDVTTRLSLISRRRQNARMRGAGRIFGWTAGVSVLMVLVISAAAGLR